MKRFFANRIFWVVFLFSTLWGCGSGDEGTAPVGIHSDSAIRTFGNYGFILQRFGSNSVLVVDADQFSPTTPGGFVVTTDYSIGVLETMTTTTPRTAAQHLFINPVSNYTTNDPALDSPQSNPHDIAFVSLSKAYITRYGQNTLLIVNPLSGERLGTVDLSVFADSDAMVEMDQMVIVNGKLYVTLQRLKGFSADNPSFVAVIDTATNQVIDVDTSTPDVIDAIILEGRNPFGGIVYLPSTKKIYVANTGTFFTTFSTDDSFGGIEVIDPETNRTEGIILHDEDIGGALGVMAVLNETTAYVVGLDSNFNNFVVPFNLSDSSVGKALADIGPSFISDLAFDPSGLLYIADQDINNPGIQVFDPSTNEKVEGPISTGLPPSEIAFVTP